MGNLGSDRQAALIPPEPTQIVVVQNYLENYGGGARLEETNAFAEAKKIAFARSLVREDPVGKTGPNFKRNVWEYYRATARWSDGLCAGLVHLKQFWPCACPCLWPYRLCRTIERASPMRARLCCCGGSNRIGSCCALPITLWVFSMPLLYSALLYYGFMYKEELK